MDTLCIGHSAGVFVVYATERAVPAFECASYDTLRKFVDGIQQGGDLLDSIAIYPHIVVLDFGRVLVRESLK